MKRRDCQDFAVHRLENKNRASKVCLRETSIIWNLTDKQSSLPYERGCIKNADNVL